VRSRPLCRRDPHAAYSPGRQGRELCLKAASAAPALAGEPGGMALDVLEFIINGPAGLLPRSR
jgi:hypothetical protein